MLRCCRLARSRPGGILRCTAAVLGKGAKKSDNPFPTATRTVIYPRSSSSSISSPFPVSAVLSSSSPTAAAADLPSSVSSTPSPRLPPSPHTGWPRDTNEFENPATMSDPAPAAPAPTKLTNFDDLINVAQLEEEVLKMWKEKDCFKTSLKLSEGRKPYNFYDGPPFATGLPHYGHLLAGTIKDMVCRYAHQTGHYVVRRFGWDCHGLPIEFEIDKQLGIKTSHDVLKFGIANYNNECEKIVMRYSEEWRKTVERVGRWIDFDNDYKTMNLPYMETEWWIFNQLWEKKLVYRGFRVMPFSTGCTTPLSNFEANLNYKDVSDPSITIAFRTKDDPNTYFLAWTTTPWTLPSNLALCVHPEVDYVKILDKKTERHYILAEARLAEVFPTKKASKKDAAPPEVPYTVEAKMKGTELVGRSYEPLFPFFYEEYKNSAFRVLSDTYVTTDTGTGVVHQAPGFGEDDFRICLEHGVFQKDGKVLCPVDENGCFTSDVTDFAGRYVKEADPDIIKALEARGQIITKGSIVHSYPFCWRSETPLLYKAVDSWFINVEAFRDRLVAANNTTYWVPDFMKTRRFGNWLEDARDWNVSRNRYWGTPIPIWHSEDWQEVICISSIAQLEELSGVKGLTNIHRQFVDDITIPSKRPGMPPLKRVSVVFDCWFESGSMPLAQIHYPFEHKDDFWTRFPADFVAEGLDQTRGWFYTLLVLGVGLFDMSPFRNVVTTGLILAEDGKKMSKRLKNYPDPKDVIDTYGADALRMYIISSPVVRGEPVRFREAGVKGMVKDVILPLFNATKFFITNVNDCIDNGGVISVTARSANTMDRWILASTQTLLRYVRTEMDVYHLYNVVPGVLRFIVDLSNWYVRMNRRRMKNSTDQVDRANALSTMLAVLFAVSRITAHVMPFVSEILYQRIKGVLPPDDQVDSVHYLMLPDEDHSYDDPDLERAMSRMMTTVDLVRVLRDRVKIPMKRPVNQVIVVHPDADYVKDIVSLKEYIQEEVNAFDVVVTSGEDYVETKLDVNFEVLGKQYRKELPAIRKAVQALSAAEVKQFLHDKKGVVAGKELTMDDVKVLRTFKEGAAAFENNTDNDVVVLLDTREDQAVIDAWRAREFVNRVQQLRKKAKLVLSDQVDVYFESEDAELTASILNCAEQVSQTVRGLWTTMDKKPAEAKLVAEEDNSISDIPIRLVFTVPQ